MSVDGFRVTVGTSPTALASDIDYYKATIRVPTGGQEVDLGKADVTTGEGFGIEPGGSFSEEFGRGELPFGVVAVGTQEVHVFLVGLNS